MLVHKKPRQALAGIQRISPALLGALLLCLPTACNQESVKSESRTSGSPTTNDEWSIPVNSSESFGQGDRGRDLAKDEQGSENKLDPNDPGDPSEPGDPNDPGDPDDPGDPSEPGDPNDPGDPSESGDPNDPGDPKAPGYPDEQRGSMNSGNGYSSQGSGPNQGENVPWPQRFGQEAKRRFEETLPITPKAGLIFGDSQQASERTIEVKFASDLEKVGDFKLLVYGFPQEDLNDKSLPQKGKPPQLLWVSEHEVKTWPSRVEVRVPSDPSFHLLPVMDIDADMRMGPGDFFGPGVNVGALDENPVNLSIDRLLEDLADRPGGEPENGGSQNQSPFPSASPSSQGCNGG